MIEQTTIDAAKKVIASASPGPWTVKPVRDEYGVPHETLFVTWLFLEPSIAAFWRGQQKLDDANFCAAARDEETGWLAFVREVERLQKLVLTEDEAEHLLARWSITDKKIQRAIVSHFAVRCAALETELAEVKAELAKYTEKNK